MLFKTPSITFYSFRCLLGRRRFRVCAAAISEDHDYSMLSEAVNGLAGSNACNSLPARDGRQRHCAHPVLALRVVGRQHALELL